jgi:hypothetical protein
MRLQAVPNGHDGAEEHGDFSVFSSWPTKRQASFPSIRSAASALSTMESIMDERRYGRLSPNRGAILLVAASLMAAIPGEIFAQQAPNTDDCQAPDANGQTRDERTAPSPKSDTSKLSDCGGILKPPATGDRGLEKPAPDVGNMPVIPPGNVPNEHGKDAPRSQ